MIESWIWRPLLYFKHGFLKLLSHFCHKSSVNCLIETKQGHNKKQETKGELRMEHNNNENNLNSNNESNSLYSYSYLNQENQERNPNYYEKQEEQSQGASGGQPSGNERTYVAGVSN